MKTSKYILTTLLLILAFVSFGCGAAIDDGIYQVQITLELETEGTSVVSATDQQRQDQVVNFAPGGYWDSYYQRGTLRGTIVSVVSKNEKQVKNSAGLDAGQIIIIETMDEKVLSLVAGDTVKLDCRTVLLDDDSTPEGVRYNAPHYCKVVEIVTK
ncbi:MAG: hypothetical protein COU63_01365 [Candidatus Pacebacteria bacterium CG10_big_fil_rev_8_21_14_0_10_36_11]|nr:hypothetical protein [Candidatus Pacearchaeota archaeon]OIP73764.1 MAG: hypothetical protein AUK08_04355 [Candidatus Pacebacteria bacterium CG2_30_36_39]PIR64651.1 MAG: hypothetical protein COU63_01365 [Candidatus Pacebacteria bacterium CG10_big_fil_rev_8_21_14_0_10_36_11]PJC42603.1 MAG: hypothetical protein CO040_03610 [Candidatus Pacebacteria bacterium CG_4_9_14_0_2_um_filter_36_8]